jgi:hypothetical protein
MMSVSDFIALMMEAESTPETSVNFYQTTWRNIPEDYSSCQLSTARQRAPSTLNWKMDVSVIALMKVNTPAHTDGLIPVVNPMTVSVSFMYLSPYRDS